MKKLYIALISLFLGSILLTACSGGSNDQSSGDDGGKTINALFMKQAGYSEDDVKAITKQYEKEHEGTKVNLTFVAYESLEQKIQTSAQSGGYDVVVMDAPWTAKFAKAGLVQDVSDRITDDMKDDVYSGAISSVTYDDKTFGMPWLNDTKFLFYNKKMLKDAGIKNPPKTWSELMTQAKKIKEQGIVEHPIVWSWSQAEALVCDYVTLEGSFGGNMIGEDGKPTIDSDKNVKSLQYMVDSLENGTSDPKSTQYLEEDVRGVFSSGKAAFALNWTYMYNLANDKDESSVAGDVGISPVPGTEGQQGQSVNGGMGLAITKGSSNADAAWDYIQYMSSKDVQKKYAKNALPIWKSLYDDPEVKKTNPAVVEASKEQYQNLVNRPKVPYYGGLSSSIQLNVQKALLGDLEPKKALENVQSKAEELSK